MPTIVFVTYIYWKHHIVTDGAVFVRRNQFEYVLEANAAIIATLFMLVLLLPCLSPNIGRYISIVCGASTYTDLSESALICCLQRVFGESKVAQPSSRRQSARRPSATGMYQLQRMSVKLPNVPHVIQPANVHIQWPHGDS